MSGSWIDSPSHRALRDAVHRAHAAHAVLSRLQAGRARGEVTSKRLERVSARLKLRHDRACQAWREDGLAFADALAAAAVGQPRG